MFLPQFTVKPMGIMKHPFTAVKTIHSFQERRRKMPAAPNISQINQQYYIKLKTDERLNNLRQDYNEFPLSQPGPGLLFPTEWGLL